MKSCRHLLALLFITTGCLAHAQIGKDGARTISAANTIVNEYTYLTANAAAGATSITVNNNNLNTNSRFSGALAQGDLIMIIQMQGASINATVSGPFSLPNDNTWGAVTNYNNAGKHEFAQVLSVAGGTTINILCGLKNDYTSSGHVQIVRVPRYTTLTVNNSLTAEIWDGNKGGIVAVEVQGATTIGAGGSIVTTGLGFRGGAVGDNVSVYGGTAWGSSNSDEGAEKGEGIAGFTTEYTPINARYCRGAPANGGGGGNGHNNGGGGGGNAGNTSTYTGYGIPNTAYNAIWNLETPPLGGTSSSGGGRGGNSFSSDNENAAIVLPNDPNWGGDYNRNNGGMGGRPLDYTTGRIFMGGGGGAGDQNDGDAGAGGRGGGIVYIMSYSTIGGTGTIVANGSNGTSADGSSPPFGGYAGIDGAGGAGAGGTVIINSTGATSGITINANGGVGGNQNFVPGAFASGTYNAAYGPGGGGGGGYIAVSSGTPTRAANGGANGTTNSSGFGEFPPKGATAGSNGLPTETIAAYSFTVSNVTICYGATATLTATITGTVPAGTTLNWYATPFGTTSLGTGTSFTTPALTTTTTYYVGFCPGWYRLPVTVTVGPQIVVNTASMAINNETCVGSDGSITGITATGGTGSLDYSWNGGTPSASANITGLTAGSYTLVVTDDNGCTATVGPYTVGSSGGPVINTTGIIITNATCASSSDGSITGITVTGTGTLTYEWNGAPAAGPTISAVPSGSYTLEVTDGLGCTSTAGPFTIGTTGGPSINSAGISITDATCGNSNGSISGITVSGGTGTLTYEWNGVTAAGPSLSGSTAGTYTLEVTDAAGCSATAGPFTINNLGGVTINTTGIVITDASCGAATGSITGITASSTAGGLSYDWSGTTTLTADYTSITGGSYTLTVTDAVGCSASAGPFTVNNVGAPTINTSAMVVNGTTCGLNNGTITGITASGGSGTLTFDWNAIPSATTDLSGATAGSYTLTVTDATGCTATAGPFTIATSNTLTATATGTNASCFGYTDGSGTGGVVGGNGTISYNWIGGPANQNYTGIGAGTYQVIVSDSQGCSDTASVTITEPASFSPSITGTATICEGQSTTLTASGGGTYSWSTSESTTSITASPTTTTTYTVDVTNGVCTETATITITVNPLPTASVSGTTVICDGQSTTLTASGGVSYTWSDASTSSSIAVSPTTTSTYYVIAQNTCGTDTAYITVTVGGSFSTDAGPDQTIGLGNTATITATGGDSFVWTPASDLGCSTCATTTASPTSTTTYVVTATNSTGCTDTDTITIIVDDTQALFVPDIFAPNGNGVNDVLYVRGSGISNFTFKVYDRWGQKVFESTDLNSGWDGSFRGKPLDTGVFVYTLEGAFYSGEEFSQKGNVTLKR